MPNPPFSRLVPAGLRDSLGLIGKASLIDVAVYSQRFSFESSNYFIKKKAQHKLLSAQRPSPNLFLSSHFIRRKSISHPSKLFTKPIDNQLPKNRF